MGDLLIDFDTNEQNDQNKDETSIEQFGKEIVDPLNEQINSLIDHSMENRSKLNDSKTNETKTSKTSKSSNDTNDKNDLFINNDRLTNEFRSDESLESKEKRKVLQELNQKLIEEQKLNGELISKLHIQLDNTITEKEELIRKLNEKESDLKEVEKIMKEQKDQLKRLEEIESTNSKLKALAIKLKKELAEAKENVSSEFDFYLDQNDV